MARERLGIFLIVLFAAISVVAIIARMIPSGKEVGRLGIMGARETPCSGELKVTSSSVNEKCALQADVKMRNCEGRWYVFKGNECGGTLVCNGEIRAQTDRWRCSWEADKGTYTFTLCVNIDKKDSATVTC